MYYLLVVCFLLSSCATRTHLSDQYIERVDPLIKMKQSESTNLLILVDGLSVRLLQSALTRSQLPSSKDFFLKQGQGVQRAHSVFPTLTFTNIAGILKEKPVHLSGALGNKLFIKNRLVDFENLADRHFFTEFMRNDNVFTRLKEKNTVSLDYGLASDATTSTEFDLKSAYAASQTDYAYLDQKKIDGLKILLEKVSPKYWPHFIFIHLVGVDFISHRFGAGSREAYDYLLDLDRQLRPLLQLLKENEKFREIKTILTADHGFSFHKNIYVPIESVVGHVSKEIKLVNEGRHAALYYATRPHSTQVAADAKKILSHKGIEIVAYKTNEGFRFESKSLKLTVTQEPNGNCSPNFFFVSIGGSQPECTNQLPTNLNQLFYPYFIQNAVSYLQAEKAPDILVVPEKNVAFLPQKGGMHGGPTLDETLVPLLLRNLKTPPDSVPAGWQLLSFVE